MARPQKVSDEEIIEAARACILEYGPEVPTSTIAEQVNVSAQALLKRFDGKANLVVAALQPLSTMEWGVKLPQPDDERPLLVQLREVARVGLEFFPKSICTVYAMQWSIVSSELLHGEQNSPLVPIIETVADWLANLHRRGVIRNVDFSAVALAFLGAIHGGAVMERSQGRSIRESTCMAYLDTLAELYADMLGAR
ncbi:TetR/AcrR family transcriptional regulator [Bradymonas sediminis]|uniref:Uncharacterized protein n=1 Tax=Bradymonas sediminis TaxID=1548548 RepID=A0A2Z4FLC9_9DELT|nr:helix-turn-helix domain-containing protein [Bradymonas sediminis]AWV89620.1 hypothetical protein DN745_09825 [Bradymonas sediminis]TDP76644.1 TetR family transcriptional regulator [Bradymonas sediminis]